MTATRLPFRKMHGLGNDFVVLDGRSDGLSLTPGQRRAIADRRTGVGCDQLILLQPAAQKAADVFMRIYNPDGGEAEACGNATRCVAALLMEERRQDHIVVETLGGLLDSERRGAGDNGLPLVGVDMGPARLDWREVPLGRACDTLHVPLACGPVSDPVATGMGNPHATFFVADLDAIPIAEIGPRLEHDPIFPQRANIGFAQILDRNRIRLRVWERSAGLTLACGSGACAAMVAAARRKLTGRAAEIVLDGGTLQMEWMADGHVMMTGAVAQAFSGTLDPSLLA